MDDLTSAVFTSEYRLKTDADTAIKMASGQLAMVDGEQYERMKLALEQTERALEFAAKTLNLMDDRLVLDHGDPHAPTLHGTRTSIGIARARIRRAR